MKIKIFSKGNGWYISCTNYKDEKDKAYINLFFPQKTDPEYIDNGRGFSVKDIDVLEARFTSFNNKVGMTIFKYVEIKEQKVDNKEHQNEQDSKMFGAANIMSQEQLPFY